MVFVIAWPGDLIGGGIIILYKDQGFAAPSTRPAEAGLALRRGSGQGQAHRRQAQDFGRFAGSGEKVEGGLARLRGGLLRARGRIIRWNAIFLPICFEGKKLPGMGAVREGGVFLGKKGCGMGKW